MATTSNTSHHPRIQTPSLFDLGPDDLQDGRQAAGKVPGPAPPTKSPASTAVPKLTPPLKWHGGKRYLAAEIVALMPPHIHYVEPYAGGLAVLLAKDPEGVSEVVNDLNGDLTNFWRCLQDPAAFETMRRTLEAMPFSEREYAEADERHYATDAERAIAFFIRCRQSLAGRMQGFASLSRRRPSRPCTFCPGGDTVKWGTSGWLAGSLLASPTRPAAVGFRPCRQRLPAGPARKDGFSWASLPPPQDRWRFRSSHQESLRTNRRSL